MKRFPKQFSDLLTKEHRQYANSTKRAPYPVFGQQGGYLHFDAIRLTKATAIVKLFERVFKDKLNYVARDLPTDFKTMRDMYGKSIAPLPWHSSSAYCHMLDQSCVESPNYAPGANGPTPCSTAFLDTVEEIGLIECMTSDSYQEWLFNVIGEDPSSFDPVEPAVQISRYQPGDSIGLHNDFCRGTVKKPAWFLDIHMSFAVNVLHQYMLFGHDRLNHQVDLTGLGSIGVYKLPLWHQVTPLIPEYPDREAYRWLIILDAWYK